ncbi:MAG: hypothetical protein HC790_09445, partial [Acaryochloridaceae cyanobacterium CSU_3_4]|nr:hypothetical protein [Acaryochloridaceae cyanobacterium CSU_3_4]
MSTGTWVIVLGVGGALEGLEAPRDTLANVDAFGRPVPSARFMGGREYDVIAGSQAPASQETLQRASIADNSHCRASRPAVRFQRAKARC